MKRIFYYGDSMKRVFTPGDEVLTHPIPAEKCRVGDIVVFTGPEGRRVIHRVIEAVPGGLRTMGDNNDAPDPGLRTDAGDLLLAFAFRRRGREFPLARGEAGMREFRRHRRRRRLRRAAGGLLRGMFRPLSRLRPSLLSTTEAHRFGEVVHREWHGRLVARCYPDGEIRFTRWYWRIFFSRPLRKGGGEAR